MIRLAITGTDTGVGKTVVTCALSVALRRRGMSVIAMKPIETGVSFEDLDRDGARLARAAGHERSLAATAPIVLSRPLSPLAAARHDDFTIDFNMLDTVVKSVTADVLLVEGAGGLLVPITKTGTFADLFHRWSLALVIVAANRLGVINHTALTVRAALAADLTIAAIVLKQVTPELPDESAHENLSLLRELFPTIPVVALPWMSSVDDLHNLAEQADASGLVAVIAPGAGSHLAKRKK